MASAGTRPAETSSLVHGTCCSIPRSSHLTVPWLQTYLRLAAACLQCWLAAGAHSHFYIGQQY